jgi:aspartate-semialdehyde dehydrogenase
VVGATGLVGTEMLRLLGERNFPVDELRVYASSRSEGRALPFKGADAVCQVLADGCFDGLDLVVIDVDDPLALEWAPRAAAAGARVVDNSAAFRTDPDVPLVVSEVNPDDVRDLPKGIVSCPNCTTMVLVTALAPLHRAAGIERLVVSTYQSVSGAGKDGMDELFAQTKAVYTASDLVTKKFPKRIAFNVIPHIDVFMEDGYTKEEWKMVAETKKILDPKIKLTATCARVPVFIGHSEAVTIEFEKPITADEARDILRNAPGCLVIDKREPGGYVTPYESAGEDATYISRIREDATVENGLQLWCVSDNLRKGAALNAVQIAECLINRKLINAKQKAA